MAWTDEALAAYLAVQAQNEHLYANNTGNRNANLSKVKSKGSSNAVTKKGSTNSSGSSSSGSSSSSLSQSDIQKMIQDAIGSNGTGNAGEDISKIISQMQAVTGNIPSTYNQPAYTNVTDARIRGLGDLNSLLGTNINTDQASIQALYDSASNASYQANLNEQANAERGYYSNMATAQDTALDTIRQQYGSAIASGASRGMQAANTLSSILGTSQAAAQQATQLAQDRQQLGMNYAAELKQNATDALKYANDTSLQVGSLAHQFYNDDIQARTAELSYNQGINTDAAGYAANQYTAQSNLAAQLAAAAAGAYNNKVTADATRYSADQNRASYENSATTSANATKYAADKSYKATKYATDKK